MPQAGRSLTVRYIDLLRSATAISNLVLSEGLNLCISEEQVYSERPDAPRCSPASRAGVPARSPSEEVPCGTSACQCPSGGSSAGG
jgi:hypothetical protein